MGHSRLTKRATFVALGLASSAGGLVGPSVAAAAGGSQLAPAHATCANTSHWHGSIQWWADVVTYDDGSVFYKWHWYNGHDNDGGSIQCA